MNHPVSKVVGQLLVSAGYGKWASDPAIVAADWQFTHGETLPDDGDLAVGIADVEGENDNFRSLRDGRMTTRPGIAVQVRAPDDLTASPKIWAIANHLAALAHRTVGLGGTTYQVTNVSRKYDPCFLMEEERSERRVWIFRALVTICLE